MSPKWSRTRDHPNGIERHMATRVATISNTNQHLDGQAVTNQCRNQTQFVSIQNSERNRDQPGSSSQRPLGQAPEWPFGESVRTSGITACRFGLSREKRASSALL